MIKISMGRYHSLIFFTIVFLSLKRLSVCSQQTFTNRISPINPTIDNVAAENNRNLSLEKNEQSTDASSKEEVIEPLPTQGCLSCNTRPRKAGPPRVVLVSVGLFGHLSPLLNLGEVLVDRKDFEVYLATHSMMETIPIHTNITFLSAGTYPYTIEEYRRQILAISQETSNFRGLLSLFNDIYLPLMKPMVDALLPQLELIEPDLLVVDVATLAGVDLAHLLHVPYILNSPSLVRSSAAVVPASVPNWGTGLSGKSMTLFERCMNVLFPRLLSVALTPAFMQINNDRTEAGLQPFVAQEDIFRSVRTIVNTAFGLEYPYKLSPLVEMTGPLLPVHVWEKRDMKLPKLISRWLKGDKRSSRKNAGVIFVTFGNMALLEDWQLQALIDALTFSGPDDPYVRVLWIMPADQRVLLPAALPPEFRVKVLGRTPHLKILAHSSVSLVISHCGMGAAQEALYFGRPLLCIPFLLDQPDIAQRVVDAGAGMKLDKTELSDILISGAVRTILGNETFAASARRISSHLKRAGGVVRAADVVQSTLQIGIAHLRPIDLMLPWHKAHMLDVWALISAFVCLGVTLLYSFKVLFCSFFGIGKNHLRRLDMPSATVTSPQKKTLSTSDDDISQSEDETIGEH